MVQNLRNSIFNQSNWYDWGCAHCSEGNYAIIMNGPRGWSGPEYAQDGVSMPTAEFYNSFEEGDTRRDVNFDIEAFVAATGANTLRIRSHRIL